MTYTPSKVFMRTCTCNIFTSMQVKSFSFCSKAGEIKFTTQTLAIQQNIKKKQFHLSHVYNDYVQTGNPYTGSHSNTKCSAEKTKKGFRFLSSAVYLGSIFLPNTCITHSKRLFVLLTKRFFQRSLNRCNMSETNCNQGYYPEIIILKSGILKAGVL